MTVNANRLGNVSVRLLSASLLPLLRMIILSMVKEADLGPHFLPPTSLAHSYDFIVGQYRDSVRICLLSQVTSCDGTPKPLLFHTLMKQISSLSPTVHVSATVMSSFIRLPQIVASSLTYTISIYSNYHSSHLHSFSQFCMFYSPPGFRQLPSIIYYRQS